MAKFPLYELPLYEHSTVLCNYKNGANSGYTEPQVRSKFGVYSKTEQVQDILNNGANSEYTHDRPLGY